MPNPRNRNDSDNDKSVCSLQAEELFKLPFADRNTINEEIHGVRSLGLDETPELIIQSLHAFRIELEILPQAEKQAYLFIQAYRQRERQQQHQQHQHQHQHQQRQASSAFSGIPSPSPASATRTYAAYADDDDFRLRFLRCCLFDVPKAVRRFANYLNFIQTYWGDSSLARPIQVSDFNTTELKILKRGIVQLLPFRDRRGRRVIANLGDARNVEDIAAVKVWFYMFDCATRDSIESQKNGVISILDGSNINSELTISDLNPETRNRLSAMMQLGSTEAFSPMVAAHWAMPTRVVCVHVCWPDIPIVKFMANVYFFKTALVARFGASESLSALDIHRIKFHQGEETEMRYAVKSYGIPIELLPLTGTNSIKLNYHNQWIKTRRLVESNQNKYQFQYNCGFKAEYDCEFDDKGGNGHGELVTIVECPCSHDVVFRNGTQSMENPGNAMFRNAILSYWAERERIRSNNHNSNSNSNHISGYAADNRDHGTKATISTTSDDTHDREFRDKLVRHIEVYKKGRFLEWDKSLNVWIQMKDKARIHRKVAMSFYNCTKRRYNNSTHVASSTERKRRGRATTTVTPTAVKSSSSPLDYRFPFLDHPRKDLSSSNDGGGDQHCCLPVVGANGSNTVDSDDDEEVNDKKRACL